jgi:O-antigen ligase
MIESLLGLSILGSVLLIPYQFGIVTRVLVIALLACSTRVWWCFRRAEPRQPSPILSFGLAACLAAFVTLASIVTNGRLMVYQDYIDLLTPLAGFGVAGLGHWIGLSSTRSHRFARGLVVLTTVFVALNFLQIVDVSTGGRFEWLYSAYAPQHTVDVGRVLADRGEANRYAGLSANPNSQASILCLLLVAISLVPSFGCWKRVSLCSLLLLIVLAQSRTAIAALLCIAPCLAAPRTWRLVGILRVTLVLALFGLVIALLVEWMNLTFIRSLFSSSVLDQDSITNRFETWGTLLEMARERPVFGNAPQQEYFARTDTHADSEYILVVWRYGLAGLAVHLSMLLLPLISCLRFHRGQRDTLLAMACLSVITGLIGLTNVTLTDFRFTVVFSLVFGLCLGRLGSRQNSDQRGLNRRSVTGSLSSVHPL